MQNIEGLYSALNALIKQKEEEGRLAIIAKDLIEEVKDEVDVYSASLDWYVQFALRAAVEVALYQAGYRSVVKGNGLFVNLRNCTKPEYMARLFNNAKLSELQKRQVVNMMLRYGTQSFPGQLSFDDTGMIVEDISQEQLIAMLIKDAEDPV